MILTRNNKVVMVLIAIASMLLGLAIVVPYKTLFYHNYILNIEIALKLGIFPVLVFLLSIYPLVLRYRQVEARREQSRIVSVMAYFPLAIYLGSIIINSLYMLTKGTEPLGQITWSIWFVVLVASLLILLILFKHFTNFEMQLGTAEHATLDICVGVIVICFGIMYYQIIRNYDVVMRIQGTKGDPYLLLCYVLTIVIAGLLIRNFKYLIYEDELAVSVQLSDLDAHSRLARIAEYRRAYNDIVNEFQVRAVSRVNDFDALVNNNIAKTQIVVEEQELVEPEKVVLEQEPVEEQELVEPEEVVVEQEVVIKKTVVKEIIEPVIREVIKIEHVTEERHVGIDVESLQKLEEEERVLSSQLELLLDDEQKLSKLRDEVAALEQKQSEEEAKSLEELRLAEEKKRQRELEKNKPKDIVPTFEDLIAFAKTNPDITVTENPEKKQVRLAIKRKVFLIMNDYPRDYRIAFFADPDKLAIWYPQCVSLKARTNKKDNWFKFTNKGELTTEFLHDIIASSCEAMKQDLEKNKKGKKTDAAEKLDNNTAAKAE